MWSSRFGRSYVPVVRLRDDDDDDDDDNDDVVFVLLHYAHDATSLLIAK
jgi:hypothetical protein